MHQSLVPTRDDFRQATPVARNLKLVQVCPSIHLECGVGNFARNCAAALTSYGADVMTVTEIPADVTADLLIQHEYALFDAHALRARLARHRGRVFLFAHSPQADRVFGDCVDAFLTLCQGMTEAATHKLVLPHPGWQCATLLDRQELKAEFGWSGYRCVIGTNGFISPSRQFDDVAKRLLPFARRENILVQVIGTRHHSHDERPGYRDQELRLRQLAAAYPEHLALEARFLEHEELNRRLQACDLAWCWTATPSGPYGSGTCADQYGSGTRLVVARKLQHEHVLSLPNVVVAPDEIDGFVEVLKREASQAEFPRHDPAPLSWDSFAERLVRFLAECPKQVSPAQVDAPVHQVTAAQAPTPAVVPFTIQTAAAAAETYLKTLEPYPERFSGRGIVICAGGVRYLTCAWVLIRRLRALGCALPIEVWSYPREVDARWRDLVQPLDAVVRTVPADRFSSQPRWAGWQLKPAAILHSSFREVLYLDADNLPVRNPTELFSAVEYRTVGTLFWPDKLRAQRGTDQWSVFGVPYREEQELESGSMLLDKRCAWKALNLCRWYNEHAEFFYRYCYGDKDTFRFAWRKTDTPYRLPAHPVIEHSRFLVQHDFAGQPLFQHRCRDKWSLSGNRRLPGFSGEEQCLAFVAELRARWSPAGDCAEAAPRDKEAARSLVDRRFQLIRIGRSAWKITFGAAGHVTEGWTADMALWSVDQGALVFRSGEGTLTYRLTRSEDGVWEGSCAAGKPLRIKLVPSS